MLIKWQIDSLLIRFKYGDITPHEHLTKSKRNVSKLTNKPSIKSELQNIKVVFTKEIRRDSGKIVRGFFTETFFKPMIFIDVNSDNIQNIIEHELLHALDYKSKKIYNFEDIIHKNLKTSDIYNFILKIYKRTSVDTGTLRIWSEQVQEEIEYFLSNKEMFVLLNNMRLFMLKKKIIKTTDEISSETIQKLFLELDSIGVKTANLDFIPILPFLKYDEHFYRKINDFYREL